MVFWQERQYRAHPLDARDPTFPELWVLDMVADAGDVLIAISSSGRSPNILLGVKAARARGCSVITLSGFDSDNPLSSMGDVNFYVPSKAYGPVEVIHHSICHCLLDSILDARRG